MSRGSVILVSMLVVALLPIEAQPATAATLVVAQDGRGSAKDCNAQTPTPYTTVGSAVAAAKPHDVIKICPATYPEQLTIAKPLTLRGESGAVLNPSGMVANTTSLTTGNALATIIVVDGVKDVTIEGLTIDGADNGISSCPLPAQVPVPNLFGIFYRNASGTVRDSAIRNMRLGPGLAACRGGTAMFVQSGSGGRAVVTIEGNSIHDFQRNGITANEAGTTAHIRRNVVTGLGPTTGAVQFGIQLAKDPTSMVGATGVVEENIVTQMISATCVSAASCASNANGVIIGSGSSGVRVARNTIGSTQTGVAVFGDDNRVQDNVIFNTLVFDGIYVEGTGNDIKGNNITRSDESGIFTVGNDNRVEQNRINEAPIGLLDDGMGNTFKKNTILNTPVPGPVAP
jgi:parallel beta-helix repeat protein